MSGFPGPFVNRTSGIASGAAATFGSATLARLILSPETDQSITAVTDTIVATTSHVDLTADADYVMTATPTISAPADGLLLFLHNIGTNTITLQDDSVLSGSDIFLGGAEGTIKAGSTMTLSYSSDAPAGYSVTSNPHTAVLGASASLLDVRNTSGASIAVGKAVHIAGWNTGQSRFLIELADADDPSKMPAIGIVAATIANGANGEVIESGTSTGGIDTSGASAGDGVWVSTTAGDVVFTAPTVDQIQRIGTVARSHATLGVIIVTGAGRTNDVPISVGRVKGADLTAANPLVIGTDGDFFTVNGDTNFVGMTIAANRRITLQFSGTPTITVGSGIVLNNDSSNYQIVAGDAIFFQSTAANTVTGWVMRADGRALTIDATGTNTGDEVSATTSVEGVVEQSDSGENLAGTADDKFPSVLGVREILGVIKQNIQTGNYTFVITDAGGSVYHPSGAGGGDIYTIPANASVPFELGTAITIVNRSTEDLTIAITTDTLTLSPDGTTGSRTLAQYSIATAYKETSTLWLISGAGLT